ncbi:MAG: MnmA/TRMU family protein [Ruminococcus callidus]
MDRFVCAYEKGWTPNPCIDCNRYLKFEKLYLRMQEMQMDTIVTGHYARVVYDEASGRYLLKKGLDNSKDQSYVLYNLTQEQLAHTQFPVGELSKHEVRRREANGFINADKPDSQDICFVPDGDYADSLNATPAKRPEPVRFSTAGEPIGTHRGVIHTPSDSEKGWASLRAVCLRIVQNTVTLGGVRLVFRRLTATDVNLISCDSLEKPVRVQAKIRYRHPEQPATAWCTPDGVLHVEFDEPQRAITCGQAVVLYDGETVVGGGRISSAEKS